MRRAGGAPRWLQERRRDAIRNGAWKIEQYRTRIAALPEGHPGRAFFQGEVERVQKEVAKLEREYEAGLAS